MALSGSTLLLHHLGKAPEFSNNKGTEIFKLWFSTTLSVVASISFGFPSRVIFNNPKPVLKGVIGACVAFSASKTLLLANRYLGNPYGKPEIHTVDI